MKRVLLNMSSFLFADVIANILESKGFNVVNIDNVNEIIDTSLWFSPCILLLEVGVRTPYNFEERLALFRQVKEKVPNTKVVFIVDEIDFKEEAELVKEAKREGVIEHFVYGSISATYLVAILETL